MNDNPRQKKTIMVTGGAGFIGSNFLNYMVPKYPEYTFVNLDALTYAGNLENIKVTNAGNYLFEHTDIRDADATKEVYQKHSPTDVIHFAAESHVDNSIESPRVFIETNVLGTEILLELARECNINRFHYVSTDEVYGSLSPNSPSSVENDSLHPNSPYSASKAAGELLVRAYHETYGLNTIITRASNNYGPNQHREKLIPLFIENISAGKKVPLYGSGKNIRNWIYVEDHVEGLDRAFHNGANGEIYNLGGTTEIENIALTKKILEMLGEDEHLVEYVPDRPGHDFRYSLDSTKAARDLAWTPKTTFEEGLTKTVSHYSK